MYRVLRIRFRPIARTMPATLLSSTEAKARIRVLRRARILVGSEKIRSKFRRPIHWNEPMPVQFVKANEAPTPVAA